jgi:hypothetical protein
MECEAPSPAADAPSATAKASEPVLNPLSNAPQDPPRSADVSTDSKELGPGEKAAKRTKHTRVHKREKELCGLVTPIFLPLLEAGDASPAKQRKEKREKKERRQKEEKASEGSGTSTSNTTSEQGSPARDAEKGKESRRSRSKNREERKMEHGEGVAASEDRPKEHSKSDSGRKSSKRSAIKKSSLKALNNTPRRRKRVSLVIDGQTVLPADNVSELPLTSPSETAVSSTSNSTTSLDEAIDPRLLHRHDTPVHHHQHQDPVHHSLPLPTTLPSTSPSKHTGHTLSESPPPLEYENPPEVASRTYFNLSPTHPTIPKHASPAPIYANRSEILDEEETLQVVEGEAEQEIDEDPADFDTYVGGLSGSGVDDVNQSGSYGYPSSLGASYLESYMKSRPLSVRIAAAEKAELEAEEKKRLIHGDQDHNEDDFLEMDARKRGREEVKEIEDDDMDVIGSMEGF